MGQQPSARARWESGPSKPSCCWMQSGNSSTPKLLSDCSGFVGDSAEWCTTPMWRSPAHKLLHCAGLTRRSAAHSQGSMAYWLWMLSGTSYASSRAATRHRCMEMDRNFVWDAGVQSSHLAWAMAALNSQLLPEQQLPAQSAELVSQTALSLLLDQVGDANLRNSLPLALWALHNSELLPGASGFLAAVRSKPFHLAIDSAECMSELHTSRNSAHAHVPKQVVLPMSRRSAGHFWRARGAMQRSR